MLNNLNQLFLATTLNCDLPEINWFAVTNFHNQNADYRKKNYQRNLRTGLQQEKFFNE